MRVRTFLLSCIADRNLLASVMLSACTMASIHIDILSNRLVKNSTHLESFSFASLCSTLSTKECVSDDCSSSPVAVSVPAPASARLFVSKTTSSVPSFFKAPLRFITASVCSTALKRFSCSCSCSCSCLFCSSLCSVSF